MARQLLKLSLLVAPCLSLLMPSSGSWHLDYHSYLNGNGTTDLNERIATKPSSAMKLHWAAPFLSSGGYCSEATSFAFGLYELGAITVGIEQHGDSFNRQYVSGLSDDDQTKLTSLLSTHFPMSKAISVCHSEPGAWHISKSLPMRYQTSPCPKEGAAVRIGRTMFETDRTPSGWAERLNAMDEVWVPTAFQRDVFVSGGVQADKLLVLPEPVDTQFFDPALYVGEGSRSSDLHSLRSLGVPSRSCSAGERPGDSERCPFRFLSVGKFERRKGFDVLLRAYLSEFSRLKGSLDAASSPHVELWILTSAYHSTSDFDAAIDAMIAEQLACPPGTDRLFVAEGKESCVLSEAIAVRPPVYLLHDIPQSLLPAVYASADAFVLPSRGEGWGRPHVEAMAMGLPVIATLWSGPSEYMTSNNSYPLGHTHLEPIPDGPFAGHLQAAPDVRQLRGLMRRVVQQQQEEAKAKGERARADMQRLYSPRALGRFIVHQVERISAAKAAEAAGKAAKHNEL